MTRKTTMISSDKYYDTVMAHLDYYINARRDAMEYKEQYEFLLDNADKLTDTVIYMAALEAENSRQHYELAMLRQIDMETGQLLVPGIPGDGPLFTYEEVEKADLMRKEREEEFRDDAHVITRGDVKKWFPFKYKKATVQGALHRHE